MTNQLRQNRPRNAWRWMLVAGGAVVAFAAAVIISNVGGDSANAVSPQVMDERPAYLIVQQEIDAELARRKLARNGSVDD